MAAHLSQLLQRLSPRWLPFADAASATLPLPRLLRLSLFQLSVGMAAALLTGTLNRILIVELQISALLVAAMIALPLLAAPWRARIGYRSDTHKSFLGWRRVPYLWLGTLLQFGGLAILPFALLLLRGGAHIHIPGLAEAAAALALLLIGLGMQTTQTAGLALATDQAPAADRPRVVALMYLALLLGMLLASLGLGALLRDFSPTRLVAVVQGAAVLTVLLNGMALWKQEPRSRERAAEPPPQLPFAAAWAQFIAQPRARRFLVALGLGTAGFAMQDVLLEPYGGLVLQLGVGTTSTLTALAAAGALLAFALSARRLQAGADPFRLAAAGLLTGVAALVAIVFAGPLLSLLLFALGTALLGLGSGLFAVATLVVAMQLRQHDASGLALGAWGAVQAGCAGLALLAGGLLREGLQQLATDPVLPFSVVYHLETGLLFAALVALGPLVRRARDPVPSRQAFGLADFPVKESSMITGYIDVAQLVLYAFWIFFAGLIVYLHRENKREGYPLESDRSAHIRHQGWPAVPDAKTFRLPDGSQVSVPNARRDNQPPLHEGVYRGLPLEPAGNPLLAGVGPGSWADRADVPDKTVDGTPRLVPLRADKAFGVAAQDVDPRGLPVLGDDGDQGGRVIDLWVDRSEMLFRYLELETPNGRRVLLPMNFARVKARAVHVASLLGHQLAEVPGTRSPEQVTLLEEEKIMAYYGAGTLYATPQRAEPLI